VFGKVAKLQRSNQGRGGRAEDSSDMFIENPVSRKKTLACVKSGKLHSEQKEKRNSVMRENLCRAVGRLPQEREKGEKAERREGKNLNSPEGIEPLNHSRNCVIM